MTDEQKKKIDTIMSESDLLQDGASVEFEENGFSIVFGAISDWYNKSISLRYTGKCDWIETLCLLYELAVWCDTDRRLRSPVTKVISQYVDHLPEPKLSIRTLII